MFPSKKDSSESLTAASDTWEKAIEVRDKPVAASDVQIFAKKCVDMAVRKAAVVMVSEQQQRLNAETLAAWAAEFGIGFTLFHGWDSFVEQALFWAEPPKPDSANKATRFIHQRLLGVEAAPSSVGLWENLTQEQGWGLHVSRPTFPQKTGND
jgi:hypothetical protein